MFNRENYDISPEDSEKSARIRRHTADLAIIDFEAAHLSFGTTKVLHLNAWSA